MTRDARLTGEQSLISKSCVWHFIPHGPLERKFEGTAGILMTTAITAVATMSSVAIRIGIIVTNIATGVVRAGVRQVKIGAEVRATATAASFGGRAVKDQNC